MYSVLPHDIKMADNDACTRFGITELALMKNAAKRTHDAVKPYLHKDSRITVLCGKGNNAGDGYEVAYLLLKDWYRVTVIDVFGTAPTSPEAVKCRNEYLQAAGVVLTSEASFETLESSDIIIDAIFGIGFSGSISPDSFCGRLITFSNSVNAFRIAIDTPSGINACDGQISECPFRADLTVTMAITKTGMLSYPAREYCGEIKVVDIGYPKELCESIRYDALVPDDDYLIRTIPRRQKNTNKGTYGKLMMFCGSRYMTGAVYLAAMGALRTGVGLVNIVRDEKTLSVLQNRLTEPIFTPADTSTNEGIDALVDLSNASTAVLLGCGLGKAQNDLNAVLKVIKNTKSRLIIDADGINALCGNINVLKEANSVPLITPHPAEFSRISGLSVEQIQSDRLNSAKNFASSCRCIVVLKGASTVIASPDGRIAVNVTGNPGLSKGGSGDVLAGVCASLACQGLDMFDCAVSGVYLHGKAADVLGQDISEYGFLPSELPLAIARLLP